MADKFVLDDSRRFNLFSRVCCFCKHLNEVSIVDPTMTCKAFPQGIPSEIWNGQNPHTTPYPGDNNIQFEKVES